jgi:SPW repeat
MSKSPATRDTAPGYDERLSTAPGGLDPMDPAPGGGWRDEVKGASGLNVLAGIWLIIAPWVLGYSVADPRWNDVIFGIIVGIFGLTRVLGAYRESWLSWLNALIGVWIFIAAFTIDSTGTASVNDIVLGVIVFVLGIWSASASESRLARRSSDRRYRSGRPITH